jgi:predicted transposase/invertase (TIGR01784 family)
VAVLKFTYDENEEKQKIYRLVSLKDQDGEEFLDKLKMVFLQMPLFRLTEPELKTRKDKWMYFLKNLEDFDEIPSILREPVFEKAFSEAEYYRLSPLLQEAYQRDLMAYRDNVNVVETARREGLAKGEAKKAAEVARNMKAKGLPPALIAELTGLPASEIERL